ncbi:MAG: hypothetical protein IPL72_00040 [Sulfuritalea sp.]|nr:hypothetical protein [Sulfuritalea sp.]
MNLQKKICPQIAQIYADESEQSSIVSDIPSGVVWALATPCFHLRNLRNLRIEAGLPA